MRNGAAPLRRGADLHGLIVMHVTLTLTLLLIASGCMLPRSSGLTDSEDVTHKMQAGSPAPGLTDPEDVHTSYYRHLFSLAAPIFTTAAL